jgi:hypothetical protein
MGKKPPFTPSSAASDRDVDRLNRHFQMIGIHVLERAWVDSIMNVTAEKHARCKEPGQDENGEAAVHVGHLRIGESADIGALVRHFRHVDIHPYISICVVAALTMSAMMSRR